MISSDAAMSGTSAKYAALRNYDILLQLFDHLHPCRGLTREALTVCARVCRAWQNPASYVLWRFLPSMHPLWMLLAGRSFPPEAKWLSAFWQYIDADDFVKDVVEREPERWRYFLHRASHVRGIGIASCGPSELALIQSLTKYNGGKTVLPSLHRLSWRHAVPADTSVLSLSSPSLRDLEIAISRLGTEFGMKISTVVPLGPPRVDPLFVGLAETAPFLSRLIISGRQGPGPAIVPHLLELTRLRELYLYNQSCPLNPEQMKTILGAMGGLEVMFARVVDFSNPGCKAYTHSLRELRLQGNSVDLLGVLSGYLDAPSLRSLSLRAGDETYSPQSHQIFSLITSSSFASSLRALSLTFLNDPSDVVWNDPTVPSFSTIIHPLFELRELEDVDLCLANCILPFADEDVAAIAQAWPRAQKLHIAYAPLRPHSRPPLTSLRHFAAHCPELQQLVMTKLAIPEALDVPTPPPRSGVTGAHPLRFLDLKMTFSRLNNDGGPLEKAVIAQYIDRLFPNLVLDDRELSAAESKLLPSMLTWEAVEQEIRLLRSQKPGAAACDRNPRV